MNNLVAKELREHARRVRQVEGGPKSDLLLMAHLIEKAAQEVERLEQEIKRRK